MKEINKGIGKRLKKLRSDKGMTQEAFGFEIEATQSYVGLMEKGLRRPSQWLVEYIAKVFEIDADWLRTGRNGTT